MNHFTFAARWKLSLGWVWKSFPSTWFSRLTYRASRSRLTITGSTWKWAIRKLTLCWLLQAKDNSSLSRNSCSLALPSSTCGLWSPHCTHASRVISFQRFSASSSIPPSEGGTILTVPTRPPLRAGLILVAHLSPRPWSQISKSSSWVQAKGPLTGDEAWAEGEKATRSMSLNNSWTPSSRATLRRIAARSSRCCCWWRARSLQTRC